jgi:hypothetical protein
MIHQISPVQTKTEPLPKLNKGLLQARHIQTQVKERVGGGLPTQVQLWSPLTSGPFIVPVTRWIE